MKLLPRHWHVEGLVCALRRHVLPAAEVAQLGPQDQTLGVEQGDWRWVRCLRCDHWRRIPRPEQPDRAQLPPLEQIPLPRRGPALRQALIVRLIAINKGLHCLAFVLAALALLLLDLRLQGFKQGAEQLLRLLGESGNLSRGTVEHWLDRLQGLNGRRVLTLLAITCAYALVEGVEAWGLWRHRRWAAYLTALVTSSLLPLEIYELMHRVTPFRVGALTVNLLVVGYLVWKERLFGLRGGHARLDSGTAAELT